ncbi:MAG TPA: hypothetical protein VFY01_10710 [Rheinheimera sp.]|nr:hypothetical protein [Rheinheimera sp.]
MPELNYPQHGVALIQVLLISTILSLMALHFTLSGRQQVQIASQMQDKVAAEAALRTLESEVLFALLTVPYGDIERDIQQQNPLSRNWNFYNKPFSHGPGNEIKLQDINGLVSLYGQSNNTQLLQLLRHLGQDQTQARRVVANLNHWQGFDGGVYTTNRNSNVRQNFLLNVAELKHIDGIDKALFNQLSDNVTTLQTFLFNPLTAPDTILQMILPAEVANEVLMLRSANTLDRYRFTELTGIQENDTLSFTPGRRIAIELTVRRGSSVAKRRTICYIRPENPFPLLWLQ